MIGGSRPLSLWLAVASNRVAPMCSAPGSESSTLIVKFCMSVWRVKAPPSSYLLTAGSLIENAICISFSFERRPQNLDATSGSSLSMKCSSLSLGRSLFALHASLQKTCREPSTGFPKAVALSQERQAESAAENRGDVEYNPRHELFHKISAACLSCIVTDGGSRTTYMRLGRERWLE